MTVKAVEQARGVRDRIARGAASVVEKGTSGVRSQVHIQAPPAQVFEVLSHARRYADWVVGPGHISWADRRFPKPGSRFQHSSGGGAVRDRTEVVASEPGQLLELDAHAVGLRAKVRFQLEEDGDGTTVVMDEEGTNTATRVLMRATRALVRARNAETVWRLRNQVEGGEDPSGPVPTSSPAEDRVPRWLGDVTARLFGLATALRGRRALHPRGYTRQAEVKMKTAGRVLTNSPSPHALVRFSRGIGLPSALPDIDGLGVRLLDAAGVGNHYDLLFASAAGESFMWALMPERGFGNRPLSTILPFRFQDDEVRLAAEVEPAGLSFDELRATSGIEIRVRAVGAESSTELLTLVIGAEVDGGRLGFDPLAMPSELAPVGRLNALREAAYVASQAVRADLTKDD